MPPLNIFSHQDQRNHEASPAGCNHTVRLIHNLVSVKSHSNTVIQALVILISNKTGCVETRRADVTWRTDGCQSLTINTVPLTMCDSYWVNTEQTKSYTLLNISFESHFSVLVVLKLLQLWHSWNHASNVCLPCDLPSRSLEVKMGNRLTVTKFW